MENKLIQYTGLANRRIIKPEDLFTIGFDVAETFEFDNDSIIFKGQAPVPADVADWLVEHDTFALVTAQTVVPKFRKEFFPEVVVEDDYKPTEEEIAAHEAAKADKEAAREAAILAAAQEEADKEAAEAPKSTPKPKTKP